MIRTLDANYLHDMSRPATARALGVHTRTLDYRLRRVEELIGLRPASTRGVRILTAAVAWAFADRLREA
ncbi:helix-turn-helix domain-containing protein [Micromonospora sp. NPDC048835]|uniref:helix-turn-helix domain-containing protein n=1 Tax=Micromonospora sp. NPDC048835 TaxID=3155147 RepID=UPI0034002A56